MRHPRTAVLAVVVAALLAAPPAVGAAQEVAPPAARPEAAPPPPPEPPFAQALAAAGSGDWDAAAAAARAAGNAAAPDAILWLKLRDGAGTWPELQGFLARNPGWPARATLRRMAERAMPSDLPPTVVIGFFAAEPPLTGTGARAYARALEAMGRRAEAEAEVVRAWLTMSMSAVEQTALEAAYGPILAPHHVERLDMQLWNGWTTEAANMTPLVPPDWQALARARIAVRDDADGSTALIRAVPEALRGDPGLVYERYLYRVNKGRWDEAEAFLIENSTSAEALGRPDFWMERRANLARTALRRGEVETAYALAAQNFGNRDSGADYADAEWVAGYIALTRLDDPEAAVGHFRRFSEAVFTPISLGRAGYWLGLAEAEAGNGEAAEAAFAAAARWQTTFYGQLAAERIGAEPDPGLVGEAPPDWSALDFVDDPVVQAGRLFALAGDEARAMLFLRHAAEGLEPGERAALAQMARDIGLPAVGVRIAKDAAADGVILMGQYYPLHDMAEADWPVPTEFALAIARQESEFNPGAVSPAGALGLMQLMPATAQEVTGALGIDYDRARLTADPIYNATLGTAYLARMLRYYDGSYVLAAASYNAGPGRVDEWIELYGDPRRPGADVVIWIETIPFEETRNYVMRVLESLHVYRARLEGSAQPLRLAADIARAS
jgi:soluble lytic murein transglycosylase